MRRKILALLLAVPLLLGGLTFTAVAEQEVNVINIVIDGERLITDVPPYLDATANRVMVPLRAIFEYADATVRWNGDLREVSIFTSQKSIYITLDADFAIVNDITIPLDCSAATVNDRTFVPLRFIMETLDAAVEWDSTTGNVAVVTVKPAESASSPIEHAVACNAEIYASTAVPREGKGGSGVVISGNGLIATNYHVIKDATRIVVVLNDGRRFNTVTIVGYDKDEDVAIIRVDALTPVYANMDSRFTPIAGDEIFCVGNPASQSNTVVTGTIPDDYTANLYGSDYIKSTLPIEPGFSGGGVYTAYGRLVGLASGRLENGFAVHVPSKSVALVLLQNREFSLADFLSDAAYVPSYSELHEQIVEEYKNKPISENLDWLSIDDVFFANFFAGGTPETYVVLTIGYAQYLKLAADNSISDKAEISEIMETLYARVAAHYPGNQITIALYVDQKFDTMPDIESIQRYTVYNSEKNIWTLGLTVCEFTGKSGKVIWFNAIQSNATSFTTPINSGGIYDIPRQIAILPM